MRFYKLALLKAYFEKGYAILSYPKYILILLGLDQIINRGGSKWVVIIGIAVGIFCFLLGWWFYESNFVNAEIEVRNQFDPFVKEMRKSYPLNRKT